MAKNYTLSEAVQILAEGKDKAALADLGKRYPALSIALAGLIATSGDSFVEFIGSFPEKFTAGIINKALLEDADEAEDDEDDENEEQEENPKTSKAKDKKKSAPVEDDEDEDQGGSDDLESKNGKELMKIARAMGIAKDLKSRKKEDIIAAINAANSKGNGKTADPKKKTDDEDWGEEDEETNPYEGKTAMELFKECKKRGIEAAPKKPAKFYIDLLTEDDADTDDDDEDWGEEEETPKSSKAKGKVDAGKEKKGSKSKPKAEEEDDWDI